MNKLGELKAFSWFSCIIAEYIYQHLEENLAFLLTILHIIIHSIHSLFFYLQSFVLDFLRNIVIFERTMRYCEISSYWLHHVRNVIMRLVVQFLLCLCPLWKSTILQARLALNKRRLNCPLCDFYIANKILTQKPI